MKSFTVIILLAAISHVAFAVFGNYKNMKKEDFLHREPPVFETASVSPANETIYEGWVSTRLNQFDAMDNRTYYMRYLMNRDHVVDGGPLFIFVGGEWTISPSMLLRGHMYDMARNLSGLMIYTEHRYYGYSTPTPNLELDNMQWLNIDQALADLAQFIVHIKSTIPEIRNSGVILVGCSYSGTMVTWFMQKYPHLAQGAWSLSAPLLAKVDFVEYKEVVSEAIRNVGGTECSDRIERAFVQMEALFNNGQFDEMRRIFRLCQPLNATNNLDVWSLFGDMAGPWSGIAQYASRRGQEIETNCANFLAIDNVTDVEAYAQWVFTRWEYEEEDCYDNTWEFFLSWFVGTEWTDWVVESAWRQWLYQTCAEYGWYQSSGSDNILFGSMFPVDSSLQFCKDLYDNIFTPDVVHRNVDRTNVIYGAMRPNVRRVYSTHGQFDPWSAMGVSEDINEESPTVILPGESHCSDLSSISDWDSPEMKASKERIFELVKAWLGVTNEDAIKLN